MRVAICVLLCGVSFVLVGCHTMPRSTPSEDLSSVLKNIRDELAQFKAEGDPATDLCLSDVAVVLKVTAEKKAGGTAGATVLKFSADVSGSLENTVTLTFKAPEAKKNSACSVQIKPRQIP